MLQAIANLGGWLLRMGQHDRSESLFYYFRIEDQVPENHLLHFRQSRGSTQRIALASARKINEFCK
jgi:hypothetical protein